MVTTKEENEKMLEFIEFIGYKNEPKCNIGVNIVGGFITILVGASLISSFSKL